MPVVLLAWRRWWWLSLLWLWGRQVGIPVGAIQPLERESSEVEVVRQRNGVRVRLRREFCSSSPFDFGLVPFALLVLVDRLSGSAIFIYSLW